jgi:hypothetical protein
MAKANPELIIALRNAADKLNKSKDYQWDHMGSCNCGFLAQEITHLTKSQIHERAMNKHGDWNEQLNDYCPTSGLLMDDLISNMLSAGLDTEDLKQLEKLSNPLVLRTLPQHKRYLKHNLRDDVVLYMHTWANLLEEQLSNAVKLPDLDTLVEAVI